MALYHSGTKCHRCQGYTDSALVTGVTYQRVNLAQFCHSPQLDELRLSASEFLDRVALLIPPPRKHRHLYFGVLAPNSPWRELVTAQAGRKLAVGRKPPQPKAADVDSVTPRS